MNLLSVLFLSLSISVFCYADQGLDDVRKSFQQDMQSYLSNLDIAAQLKPLETNLGSEISKTECEAIQEKSKAAESIDPFVFIYEGGASEAAMCGGRYGFQKNFIVKKSGKTSFGKQYDFIVQTKTSKEESKEIAFSSYYFNSLFQIVNNESIFFNYLGELHSYEVATKDTRGSYFQNYYDKSTSYPQKNIAGRTDIQVWVPYDGSVSHSILRNKITDEKNPNHTVQTLLLSRTDVKDFDSFALPITHSWSDGGFFIYEGKYYNAPSNYSTLSIKFQDEKEVCSYAMNLKNKNWSQYPSDKNLFYQCFNF